MRFAKFFHSWQRNNFFVQRKQFREIAFVQFSRRHCQKPIEHMLNVKVQPGQLKEKNLKNFKIFLESRIDSFQKIMKLSLLRKILRKNVKFSNFLKKKIEKFQFFHIFGEFWSKLIHFNAERNKKYHTFDPKKPVVLLANQSSKNFRPGIIFSSTTFSIACILKKRKLIKKEKKEKNKKKNLKKKKKIGNFFNEIFLLFLPNFLRPKSRKVRRSILRLDPPTCPIEHFPNFPFRSFQIDFLRNEKSLCFAPIWGLCIPKPAFGPLAFLQKEVWNFFGQKNSSETFFHLRPFFLCVAKIVERNSSVRQNVSSRFGDSFDRKIMQFVFDHR